MPKIRGVKPDLWTDEDFVELSPYARLLWIGLWNYACDNGHLADKSKQIKMRILPTDEVNCAELLREIAGQGLIERGDGWITIPNLTRHQKVDRRYFTTCEKDGCDDPAETVSQRAARRAPSGHTAGARGVHDGGTAGALGEVKGSELKGSDGENTDAGKPAKRSRQLPHDFEPNDANRRLAAERGLDLASVVAQFCDFHRAKGSTMKDWNLALNTWIRRERATGQPAAAARSGWSTPQPLPPCPSTVADDAQAYASWLRDWNAGRDVPTADGGTARKAS